MTSEMIEKGKRINGKRANAERYIPFYEFLLFDPLYRKMNEKAKILYTYLRNKVKYFEYENERYEQGEGTKSYLDEDSNTFIVADNTELSYILNCAESTLIRIKKEISNYGLLEEVKRKDKSNQIYPLEPETLSETWKHIEEIKNNREAKIKKDKEKHSALKEEKKHEETEDLTILNHGNLQNESHGNLQNESHGNLQNEREIQSKNYKSNLRYLNNESKNLSINIEEKIKNTDLPPEIQKTLMKNRDRLIDSSIDVQDVVITCNAFIENTAASTVNYVLDTMLNNAKTSIKNFRNYFSKSINNYYENLMNKIEKGTEPESNEVIPEWFKDQKEEKANKPEETTHQEEQITQEEIQTLFQQFRSQTQTSD